MTDHQPPHPAPDAKCANCGLSFRVHKPVNYADPGQAVTKPLWLCPIYLFRERVTKDQQKGRI